MSTITHPSDFAPTHPSGAEPPARTVGVQPNDPLQHLDAVVESALGADMRLIYGLAVPMLAVIAAMIPMFLFPSYVLDGAVLLFELGCLAFVVHKLITAFLNDDGDGRLQ